MGIQSYIKDGKKLFLVEVKGRDKSGKQVYRSRQNITSERKAEEALFELKMQVKSVINQEPVMTWGNWLGVCLEKMKSDFAPSTIYTYEKCLNRYVTSVWENKFITHINRSDVQDLIFERLPAGSTPHTRKATLKLLRRILQMAVDAQKITINPCAGIKVKAPVNDQKVLNQNEVATLLIQAQIQNHYFYDVWVMALKSGMRSGE